MTDNLEAAGLVLHIWPGQWELPSFDPLCLAAVLYLQLAVPGKFSITECSNPDSSPTGQLPFLVHEQYTIASFPSIVKYVSGLRSADHTTYPHANLDVHLTPREKAQKTAWDAHAESHLGDLLYHYLYSNQENWTKMTGPTLASMFPVPQKYYVPRRIRDSYHQRLLTAGLWKPFVEEKSPESPFTRDTKPVEKEGLTKNPTLSQAFEREKLMERARTELDIYQELLDDRHFVFQNQPSSVDVLIAAHILLLLDPPYPDTVLKTLITEAYPSILSHTRRIYDDAFGEGKWAVAVTPPSSSLWGLIPSWPKRSSIKKQSSPEEIHDAQIRWGFFGLVIGSFAAYFAILGPRYNIVRNVAAERSSEEEET
ncbi:Tom37 C-terminal domain-containing protein [Flammula alnicola]|nr:Tom37 C-terminal domain-containing protein [Flammula alnicola]